MSNAVVRASLVELEDRLLAMETWMKEQEQQMHSLAERLEKLEHPHG